MGRYLRLAVFFYVEILQGDPFWLRICISISISWYHYQLSSPSSLCKTPPTRTKHQIYHPRLFHPLHWKMCALRTFVQCQLFLASRYDTNDTNNTFYFSHTCIYLRSRSICTGLSDLHLHEVIYDVSNVHLPFAMCLNFTWTHVYVFTSYLLVCLYLHSKCTKCNAPLRGDISDCSLTQGSEKVRPWKKRDAFEDVILLKACRFFTLHDTCVLCHYCGWHVKCVLRPTAFKSPRFLFQTEHSAAVSKYGNMLVAWV